MRRVGGADIEKAIALFEAGNAAGAAQACRAALLLDGRNVTARFLLALTQMQLRDFEEAERQFAKATALDPAAAEIWANRGNNQIALGRADRALEFITRALQLEPNFPEALYNQAKLLADAGRLDEALSAYDKCSALVPGFADALQAALGIEVKPREIQLAGSAGGGVSAHRLAVAAGLAVEEVTR